MVSQGGFIMKVDECAAGLELDAQVAKIMGYRVQDYEEYSQDGKHWEKRKTDYLWLLKENEPAKVAPKWSTDITAAWGLVEKLSQDDKVVRVSVDAICNSQLSSCSIHEPDLYETMLIEKIAETAPLAIVRAFLKANEVEYIEVPECDD
jgi:hypothetical protein